jgi:hypothetical protein
MNCLLVSCRLLYFLPETHEIVDIATKRARKPKKIVLFMIVDYLLYNNLNCQFIVIRIRVDEAKIRKSLLCFSKQPAIIIVIFADYFLLNESGRELTVQDINARGSQKT